MTEAVFETYSFWERVGKERPVILYGTGNGADKIIDCLEIYGIRPVGIFASDGFVRNRFFRGIRVSSYRDIVERYGEDITVLISFGTTNTEVLNFISKLDKCHEVIIPEVPLYGGELFTKEYFLRNKKKIITSLDLFEDEESKRIFIDTVNFRLTGKLCYLKSCEPVEESIDSLFGNCDVKVAVDGGAYKGDTLKSIIGSFPGIEKIYAVEPDPGSISKISKFFSDVRIHPVNAALSSTDGFTSFNATSSRGSGVLSESKRSKKIEVEKISIDNLLSGEKCNLIKLDVEGNEADALFGAQNTVLNYSPCLLISLYHRTDDLFDLPRMVRKFDEGYKLFLRRPYCVPMWDLNLFAKKERIF